MQLTLADTNAHNHRRKICYIWTPICKSVCVSTFDVDVLIDEVNTKRNYSLLCTCEHRLATYT